MVPNFVLGSKNPQHTPEGTPTVFSRLRPCTGRGHVLASLGRAGVISGHFDILNTGASVTRNNDGSEACDES